MNSYEKQGIAIDILKGRRILICARHTHARIIFHDVLKQLEDLGYTPNQVRKINGQERIDLGTGWLVFAHTADAIRGYEADRVLFSVAIREQPSFREKWLLNARLATERSPLDQPIEQLSA